MVVQFYLGRDISSALSNTAFLKVFYPATSPKPMDSISNIPCRYILCLYHYCCWNVRSIRRSTVIHYSWNSDTFTILSLLDNEVHWKTQT